MVRDPGQRKDSITAGLSNEELGITLLQRIAAKDKQAFEQFYFDYTPRIGNFMMKILKSPELVDEAINDFMMVIWQNAGHFDADQGKLSTWLFGIAHNKALKVWERQRRYNREESSDQTVLDAAGNDWDDESAEETATGPDNPERTVLGWELGDILVWAMARLSPEHQVVLDLVFNQHYNYEEVAAITDCPVNTVKTRVFHARKKLAEILKKRGINPYELNGGPT